MCEKLLFTLCFTVHKPKITIHGQLTVTQALIFKKKKKKKFGENAGLLKT